MAFTWRFLWRLLTDACELVNDVSLVSVQGIVSTFYYSVLLVFLGVGVVHVNAVSYAVVLHAISVILGVALGLLFVWLKGVSFHNLVGGAAFARRIPLRDSPVRIRVRKFNMNPRFAIRDWLLSRLQYAELRGVPVDSPEMTLRRRELLERNVCAHFSFERWYRELAGTVATAPEGLRVELGSGGGFLDQFIGSLIKTDVVELPFIDKVCQAERLPFPDSSTGALVMVNVLHHVGDVDAFLREAVRILVPSGVIAMIEPYVSSFSRLIYRYVHHEPFDPDAVDWRLPPGGRLSGGNAALPWVVFVRDRARFERDHPALRIESLRPHSPFSHLLSGGVTTRPLAPLWAIRSLVWMEARVPWAMPWLGVFFTVILRRSA